MDDDEEEDESKKSSSIMGMYLQPVMEAIMFSMDKANTSSCEPMLLETLNLLSIVSSIASKNFTAYYGKIMPVLKNLLGTMPMTTSQQKNIRAKIVQTMGFMIEAVQESREEFLTDVISISKDMASVLSMGLQEDDPQAPAIKESLIKSASLLKEEFHQFMPNLLNSLVTDANADIDIKLTESNIEQSKNPGFTFKLKGMESEAKITMNTSALENKIKAVKNLAMLADSLEESFAPYVEQLYPIMDRMTNYELSRAIRKSAFKSMGAMLRSLQPDMRNTLFTRMAPNFFTNIQKANGNVALNELKFILKELANCLKAINTNPKTMRKVIDMASLQQLIAQLNATLTIVKKAKTDVGAAIFKKLGDVIDDEDMEEV